MTTTTNMTTITDNNTRGWGCEKRLNRHEPSMFLVFYHQTTQCRRQARDRAGRQERQWGSRRDASQVLSNVSFFWIFIYSLLNDYLAMYKERMWSLHRYHHPTTQWWQTRHHHQDDERRLSPPTTRSTITTMATATMTEKVEKCKVWYAFLTSFFTFFFLNYIFCHGF